MRLEDIHSPQDLRGLSYEELDILAGEIREALIATVSRRGGHLASNLGVVELTLALHRVFHTPEDKLVFDVGHQSYVHKLLTGRYDRFDTLRAFGGLSGFPRREESEYDTFGTGHASTAISAALGMARARDYLGQKHHVVAVVGDGALTGGMCYEALNDAGNAETRLIVILNDNEMSISPNVGALSRHLTNLRVSKGWATTKKHVRKGLKRIPLIGPPLYQFVHWSKNLVKSIVLNEDEDVEGFFGSLGFHYYGPIDGHDIASLEHTLALARDREAPVLIHVMTRKGHGYEQAEARPETFHGTPPFFVDTGDRRSKPSVSPYGTVMANTLAEMAGEDKRIVAITAAMVSGTGLHHFQDAWPDRLIDVGIAEEHAVTMAAGLACGGMRPYFAVYASFFQRCVDQWIEDVCLQKLPVTVLLDHAGLAGQDGVTHHGIFDLSELLPVPGLTVLAPKDIHELRAMLLWTAEAEGPVAIRYGKDSVDLSESYPCAGFTPGQWETLEDGQDAALLAVGSMVPDALETRRLLEEKGIRAAVINCSSLKPLDEAMLRSLNDKPVFTLEEHLLTGGFGETVTAWAQSAGLNPPRACCGIRDTFVSHGTRAELMRSLGLAPDQLAETIAVAIQASKQGESNG